ncbi:MAG TPA: alpha/beta hydrolase [Actinophytocola sp.]|uniref:alpha/beta fold hydrolase n=1 Tax=Actinophytocola sp. TaxID=1872138 RepID=UPI002DBF8B16|nr:alpha/beta hydrolase [Actinophytocola sp.]HEU5470732.1 alpha/beta hydrolase [Actinophytocola sp.]
MPTVTSADGTTIAYERTGSGPPLVLVDGAMCYRAAGPARPLAAALHEHFTVYTYDRRGRGDSADTPPYSPAREIEDLQAVLAVSDPAPAFIYGISSGAALCLATAAVTPRITRLALYEPPFLAEAEPHPRFADYTARLRALLAAGRRGDAVALFMAHVGIPAQAIDHIRTQPAWPVLEAIAPTLAYDDEILGDSTIPRHLPVTIPTLLLSGGASPQTLQQAAKSTAHAFPNADHHTLPNQTHDVSPDALAPALTQFFTP